jgi:DNA-binding NarL/FixJ family response regulator
VKDENAPPVLAIRDPRLAARVEAALAGERGLGGLIISDSPVGPAADRTIVRFAEQRELIDALREGADVVLPSSADEATIRLGIEAALAGYSLLPAPALRKLMDALGPPPGARHAGDDDGPPRLSPREREVLQLVAEGASNKLIARRLGISYYTVKFHVAAILDKLDSTGRADAVAQAARLGLILL